MLSFAVAFGYFSATYTPPLLARINIRWAPEIGEAEISRLLPRLRLEFLQEAGQRTRIYYLHDDTPQNLRAIVEEPAVEDTHGIDRTTFHLSEPPRRPDLPAAQALLPAVVGALVAALAAPWLPPLVSRVRGGYQGRRRARVLRNRVGMAGDWVATHGRKIVSNAAISVVTVGTHVLVSGGATVLVGLGVTPAAEVEPRSFLLLGILLGAGSALSRTRWLAALSLTIAVAALALIAVIVLGGIPTADLTVAEAAAWGDVAEVRRLLSLGQSATELVNYEVTNGWERPITAFEAAVVADRPDAFRELWARSQPLDTAAAAGLACLARASGSSIETLLREVGVAPDQAACEDAMVGRRP